MGEAIFDGDINDALEPLAAVARTTTELGAAPLSFHEQYTLCAAGIAPPDTEGWLWTGSTYAEAALHRSQAEWALSEGRLDAAMDSVAAALRIELPQAAHRGPRFSLEAAARILIAQERWVDRLRIMGACDAFRRDWSHRLAPCLGDLRDDALLSAHRGLSPSQYQDSLIEWSSLSVTQAADLLLRLRGRRGRPVSGWEALTPTEARVAALVGEGMTNREVGRELLMSPETVKTHLSRVFAKVGVANRKELIVATHRRDETSRG